MNIYKKKKKKKIGKDTGLGFEIDRLTSSDNPFLGQIRQIRSNSRFSNAGDRRPRPLECLIRESVPFEDKTNQVGKRGLTKIDPTL